MLRIIKRLLTKFWIWSTQYESDADFILRMEKEYQKLREEQHGISK
jgi:hypothetical protein